MLACTQKKIDEMGREGVRAFQHSLHDTLPFEDNTFDVVLHNQVMHHLVYPENQDPLAIVKRYDNSLIIVHLNDLLKPIMIGKWKQEECFIIFPTS